MSSTTDRTGGSEDPFAVAESLQSVVRDTAAVGRQRPAGTSVDEHTEAISPEEADRDTPPEDDRRDTVVVTVTLRM